MDLRVACANVVDMAVCMPVGIVAGSLACACGTVEGCARTVMNVAMAVFKRACGDKAGCQASMGWAKAHSKVTVDYAIGIIPIVSFGQMEPMRKNKSLGSQYIAPLLVLIPAQLILNCVQGVCKIIAGKNAAPQPAKKDVPVTV